MARPAMIAPIEFDRQLCGIFAFSSAVVASNTNTRIAEDLHDVKPFYGQLMHYR